MANAAKKIEPKGEWLSTSEMAKRLQLHRQTVTSRLEDLGYEPDEDRSSVKNKVYWFDDEMEFAVKAAKDSLTAAKIRDLRVKTEINEIKLAEARGELVPKIEVIELSQKLHSVVFKELSINIPKDFAKRLSKETTQAGITKILKQAAERFLKRLREDSID